MKEISKRYQAIFEEVYEKRAKDRYLIILNIIEMVIASTNIANDKFHVDLPRISNLVDSYFLDVIRYKEYHFNMEDDNLDPFSKENIIAMHTQKLINDGKVLAFLVKWFMKYSPVTFIGNYDDIENCSSAIIEIIENINEYISLQIIIYSLFDENDLEYIDPNILDSLFYDLKYRFFDEKIYFSRIELLQKSVKALSKTEKEAEDGSHALRLKKFNEINSSKMTNTVKTLKIFVSSAADVEELRKTTDKVLSGLNNQFNLGIRLDYYMWEKDKDPGYLMDNNAYMDQVLNEFGNHCDLFILLLWSKIGAGTLREYDFFKTVLLPRNPKIKLLVVQYGKNQKTSTPEAAKDLADFLQWINDNQNSWAPLGSVRKELKNTRDFEFALREAINKLI